MFCIFAFVLFLVLGIFSASYRSLAKKAWGCVWIRLTFRACDISLQEEIRARFIGKYIVTRPRLAQFITKWIDAVAFIFVALSIWSLLVVVNSGINYYVYDTCSPSDPESCSLSAGACGVAIYKPTFFDALKTGNALYWMKDEVVAYGDKLGRIPDRMKTWNAEDFVPKTATYAYPFEANKKTAIEIVDPGCTYCSQLFKATKNVEFGKKYNFTYILYPIPNPEKEGEYKFKNSLLIAKYIEGVKKYSRDVDGVPADWKILEKIFLEKDVDGSEYQILFNEGYESDRAESEIQKWLKTFGYDAGTINKIKAYADGEEAMQSIKDQKRIVDEEVRTVKIPTIMFNGRRYDRLVDEKTLVEDSL